MTARAGTDEARSRLKGVLANEGLSGRAWNVLVRAARSDGQSHDEASARAVAELGERGLVDVTASRVIVTALGRSFVRRTMREARSKVVTRPVAPATAASPTLTKAPPITPVVALGHIVAISKRNLIRIRRTPQLIAFSSVQPVLFVLLFRYVFGGAVAGFSGGTYVDFLMPGIFVQATLFAGGATAGALAEDFKSGIVDRFRALPMARSAVLAGRSLADLARNVLTLTLMVVVGTLVGFRFHNGFVPGAAALLLVLAFGYATGWLYATVALVVKDPETAQIASILPTFVFIFASSSFVPVQTMPGWLQAFANVQPVSVTVNAARALMQGGPVYHWLWQSIAWIVGLLVVLIPVAVRQYRRS